MTSARGLLWFAVGPAIALFGMSLVLTEFRWPVPDEALGIAVSVLGAVISFLMAATLLPVGEPGMDVVEYIQRVAWRVTVLVSVIFVACSIIAAIV